MQSLGFISAKLDMRPTMLRFFPVILSDHQETRLVAILANKETTEEPTRVSQAVSSSFTCTDL